MFKHVIDIDTLYEWMHDEGRRLVIADSRFVLGVPEEGRRQYEKEHLPSAIYFDLEDDLSGPKQTHGGRHPLPELEKFAQKVGQAGVDENTWVVAYDDDGAMASRLWWLLRYMGHERVKVLDGGYSAWKAKGYPTSTEVLQPEARVFTPRPRPEMLADKETVQNRLHDPDVLLLDSRESRRYLGEVEPIDPIPGHIPGARHFFWKETFHEDGRWKGLAEQRARFEHVRRGQQPREVIVYCGSGVSACPNVLALDEAGVLGVSLYVGSWSDWCSFKHLPIARGEE